MERIKKQELWLTASCLLCVVVGWAHVDDPGASEFLGGRLTGPLFEMAEFGMILFVVASLLTFFFQRVATPMALVASFLCIHRSQTTQ